MMQIAEAAAWVCLAWVVAELVAAGLAITFIIFLLWKLRKDNWL